MDESNIVLSNDDYEVIENAEILPDVAECFDNVPDVARPLIGNAERLFKRIERTLYSAPSFISAVKATIPEEIYQVILTDEQKEKIDLFTDYAAEEEKQKAEDAALERERKIQAATLAIKKKYGKNAILKAMNLEEGATAKDRNAQIGGHKA